MNKDIIEFADYYNRNKIAILIKEFIAFKYPELTDVEVYIKDKSFDIKYFGNKYTMQEITESVTNFINLKP